MKICRNFLNLIYAAALISFGVGIIVGKLTGVYFYFIAVAFIIAGIYFLFN